MEKIRARVSPPKAIKGTRVTILGCGTSTGIPLLACKCATCASKDPRNRRMRASILVQTGNRVFLIDTSPDLYHQALRNKIRWNDAVLYTHPHADHLHGIDDLRSFNFIMARAIPCYGNEWSMTDIRRKFS